MKMRLIDRDGDLIEANGESQWSNFASCKKDIIEAIKASSLSLDYLPYKFVDYDSSDDYSTMDVHAKISEVFISLDTETFQVSN